MTRSPRTSVAAVLLALTVLTVALLTGCGDDAGRGGSPPPPGPPVERVVGLSVHVSGGFAGLDETVRVDPDAPAADALFAEAAGLGLVEPEQPTVPCCDRIGYTLTVTTVGGRTATYGTWDGGSGPVLSVVRSVLRAAG